jgi:hypothetical protein
MLTLVFVQIVRMFRVVTTGQMIAGTMYICCIHLGKIKSRKILHPWCTENSTMTHLLKTGLLMHEV